MRLFPDIRGALKDGAQAIAMAAPAAGSDGIRRDAAGIPTAFRVFKPGVISLTVDGKLVQGILDPADIEQIAAHAAMKGELIPLDCEHFLKAVADQAGVEEAQVVRDCPLLAERAVAGGVSLKAENGELWASVEKLADRARTLLSGAADKLYMYFSPVVRGIKEGPLRVSSVALTNEPALNNLDVLAATDAAAHSEVKAYLKAKHKGDGTMREKIRKLCEMLKLDVAAFSAESADVTPVLSAALAAIESGTARERRLLADLRAALALTDADTLESLAGKLLPVIEKAKTDATALSDAQARLTKLETAEKGRTIAALKAEGKLTEAMLPWAEKQDIAALMDWAKTAPVVAAPNRVTVPGAGADAGDTAAMTDSAAAIARRCGLDPAQVAKANGLKFAASVTMAFLAGTALCLGAALTDNRDTPEMAGKSVAVTQGSNVVYAGSMGAVSNGLAVRASDNAGLAVIGRMEAKSDNTGANYLAARKVAARRGVFRWANGGSFTAADIGNLAYVQDDQTVTTAAAATADIVAGVIVGVDSDGVWVDTYAIGGSGAASVTTLNASGNAAVGGTLAVTGNTTLGGTAGITGNTTVGGTLGVTGNTTLGGTAGITGNTTVGGTLGVTGATTLKGTTVNGSLTVTNALVVSGASVSLANVPTSTNGLAAGAVWSDSGALKIMP